MQSSALFQADSLTHTNEAPKSHTLSAGQTQSFSVYLVRGRYTANPHKTLYVENALQRTLVSSPQGPGDANWLKLT